MGKFFKSKKGKIIASVLALVIIVSGVGSFFLARKFIGIKVDYDFKTGMLVKNRVQNAQYLPNLDLLVSDEVQPMSASSKQSSEVEPMSSEPNRTIYLSDLSFSLEDYQDIVDELAIITGTATRNDTNILEIKEEIYTVLEMVPSFGKWFQLPRYFEAEHAQDGFNNFYYKLDYDKSSDKISITRMTWSYTCGAYSYKDNKIYSTYLNDDIKQYQIMQANYYYNEDNKEVVECSVVDFAKFNNNFYPIQCQYLANIQDTSTTKIQSVIRKDVECYEEKITNNPGGNIGRELDIDTYREGGVMKKVVQLNYTDSDNVELIKIEQNSGTNYYSDINTTNLAYYLKEAENAIYFVDAWDYYDETSKDEIDLNNVFSLRTHNLSKDAIIESFKNSDYATRQVMGHAGVGSSNTVCNDCYNKTIDSGILVYKCNHNKNKTTISRASREIVFSNTSYKDEKYQLLPWHISNVLVKFAKNVGISNQEILSFSSNLCKQLNLEYLFENNLDIFLTKISKEFIENISLVKDVSSLYNTIKKESVKIRKSSLNKSAISSEIKLENLSSSTSISNNEITINTSVSIKSTVLLEKNSNYSLGLVLFDSSRNINYTLLTNFVTYNGGNLTLPLNGTYNLSNFKLDEKDVKANLKTSLTLGYVLLKESSRGEILCSNYVNATLNASSCTPFTNTVNGYECFYVPTTNNNTLTLTISCTDEQKPEISLKSLNNSTLTMSANSKVYNLLSLLSISDNDAVKTIVIYHDNTKYAMSENLTAGTNKIVVTDRAGNTETLTFSLELV